MALSNNLRSLIQRIVLSDVRTSIRFYSDQADGAAADETQKDIDPTKDRTKIIPVETSMKYLNSKAYQQTYGDQPVWVLYRRNHKGGFAPRKTRKSCVRNDMISTGNPCPICRDEYLVLDHRNTKLLEQFISEYTGQVLDSFKTGLCQRKHKELLVAIERAWDQGYLTYDVPFREYDYKLYMVLSIKICMTFCSVLATGPQPFCYIDQAMHLLQQMHILYEDQSFTVKITEQSDNSNHCSKITPRIGEDAIIKKSYMYLEDLIEVPTVN